MAWTEEKQNRSAYRWYFLDPYKSFDDPQDYHFSLAETYPHVKTYYGVMQFPPNYYAPVKNVRNLMNRFMLRPKQADSMRFWKVLYEGNK